MLSPLHTVAEQMRAAFPPEAHPSRVLQRAIRARLRPGDAVLDIGCGRAAPLLRSLADTSSQLFGIDLVPFTIDDPMLRLANDDVADMQSIASSSIDLAYSCAVMEHLPRPEVALREIFRVLRPGGAYLFLTPSLHDYGTVLARLVPNAWHGRIVRLTEGRAEEDTFPTHYGCNSRRQIARLAASAGLEIAELSWVGQYPSYLVFNRVLFWLGSLYQKGIERFAMTRPLQGWILCVLERPACPRAAPSIRPTPGFVAADR